MDRGTEKALCSRRTAHMFAALDSSRSLAANNATRCRTATPDDHCFANVQWAHLVGLQTHPEWYPTLSPSASTFEDVQRVLHSSPSEFAKYGCPEPCRPPPWEDPTVNQRRREAPHASMQPAESEALAAALALDAAPLEASSRVLMLSGPERAWRFHYAAEIHQRPSVHGGGGKAAVASSHASTHAYTHASTPSSRAGSFTPFYSPAFNDSSWASVAVPSNWEMLGYGVPLYVNIPCAYARHAPFATDGIRHSAFCHAKIATPLRLHAGRK